MQFSENIAVRPLYRPDEAHSCISCHNRTFDGGTLTPDRFREIVIGDQIPLVVRLCTNCLSYPASEIVRSLPR